MGRGTVIHCEKMVERSFQAVMALLFLLSSMFVGCNTSKEEQPAEETTEDGTEHDELEETDGAVDRGEPGDGLADDSEDARDDAHVPSDCYFEQHPGTLVLGNSLIEIRFSKTGGQVLSLMNKSSGTSFVSADYNTSSYFLRFHEEADMWHTSHWRGETTLATGWDRPLTDWRVEEGTDTISLEMDNEIQLGAGTIAVTQKVKIFHGSPFTRWSIALDSETATAKTVVSVTFPHLRGIDVFGGDDYLIAPARRGMRWEEFHFPRQIPEGPTFHLRSVMYPVAPWQWIWYGNPREGLYVSALDTAALPKAFRFGYDDHRDMAGVAPQDNEMAVTHFPFLEPGNAWTSYEMEVGIQSGPGWYWGADRYKDFMENTAGWTREYPRWAVEAHSFLRATANRYDEYWTIFANVWEPRGDDVMIDEAWWLDIDGHEWPYPVFELDPEKGGFDGLQEGMRRCHEQGDRLIYFSNTYHGNKQLTWYREHGSAAAMIDPDGEEVPRSWHYLPDQYSDLCFWSEALRDRAVADQTVIAEAGVDGVWLDCVLVFSEHFCYNPDHGHISPAHAVGPGLVGLLARLNDEVWRANGHTETLIGIEGIHDFLIPYVDYWLMHWMAGYQGPSAGERDYPEVARYLFPGVFGALREGDELDFRPFPQPSFIFGCKFDGGLARDDNRRAKYYDAYDNASDAFYYGTFKADLGLTRSRDDFKALSFVGSAGDNVVVTLWNRGDSEQSVTIGLDLALLGVGGGVASATDLMERELSWSGGSTFTSTVPANEVTAVKLTIF